MDTKEDKYGDWVKKIQEASGLKSDEGDKDAAGSVKEEKVKKKKISKWTITIAILIFIIAASIRLFFLFNVSDPQNAGVGWYGDTYHHWQIAYLTKEIGLSHGFLRLWDLKGMEYFWGPLHPLMLTIIFWVTGSTNIAILRLLSLFFGLASIVLLSLLALRFFGKKVAFATLFFGALFPIAVFNDVTGSLEPIGTFFLLLGIYFWPQQPLLTGLSFAASTMVRAEAWIFSLGLLFGMMFTREDINKKIVTGLSYSVIMLFYMKYMLDNTGNAIYPVWWNFLANGLGAWAGEDPLSSLQQTVKPILIVLGVFSALILFLILYKRPKSMLLLLLGFGNIFFVTAFMGFGHYISGWEWWFPVIRFFVFPYLFVAMLVFLFLEKVKFGRSIMWSIIFGFVVVFVTLVSQWTWIPILERFKPTVEAWEITKQWGKDVGSHYSGGTVLFPEGDPHFTYTVVQYGKIQGENILGQMFDPFYYIGENEAFGNWNKHRKTVLSWFTQYNVKLAVIRSDSSRYQKLIKHEKNLFEKVGILSQSSYEIWRVYPERIKKSN